MNGNLKTYAAWWLWAKLAGWNSASGIDNPDEPSLVNFHLFQNFPNPFNPNTSISFTLMKRNYITLKVYDQLGNEVEVLANSLLPEGYYEYSFNSKNYSSGVYFYRLKVGNEYSDSKKMILLK